MHFSTLSLSILPFLATTASAASCTIDGSAAAYHWEVRASGVYGIPGWCGGLWDNLNRWGGLCNPSYPYCNGQDGEMVWRFTTSVGCMRGHVESVWWEATKNEFGAITCVDAPEKREVLDAPEDKKKREEFKA
ncbi:hypothetical protein COCMIDRAFT_85664 [Bipolaris oryzae ATCC 44560]|uniref:Uncharacterized protein n=1 Tax=Bipolaris oryzae ATCC 44560 TaxID=930090 RepID=W6ZB78_COCMI|nr:uncharacterized protein COCMIDRAFT_85664 [Bipolaris oryzae ATCC 44560]EUC49052.1 hypothetical protein COCMIDRAFT_85664 [Bipolaris oryzae ATCC 44560]